MIEIQLAGGGDERVNPERLIYIRDPLNFELDDEPTAQSVLSLPGAKLLTVAARDVIASLFAQEVQLARLTAPNGAPLYVRATGVVDVDEPVSTNPEGTGSWLVFGTGPRARRLAVRETRSVLEEVWTGLGLTPTDHGI